MYLRLVCVRSADSSNIGAGTARKERRGKEHADEYTTVTQSYDPLHTQIEPFDEVSSEQHTTSRTRYGDYTYHGNFKTYNKQNSLRTWYIRLIDELSISAFNKTVLFM